jgi:hypothetical protein
MFNASSLALTRLAKDERFIGTALPGFTGVLHTWGRQLQYHPHIHYIVPGGGLSEDRPTWQPARANCFVPVKALSPLSRAIYKEELSQAGRLEHIAPQGWTIPWNVHSQAHPHSHPAFTYLAPSVFKVAISNSRIVCLKDRTVPFTYRKPGRARPRTTNLDAMEFSRRFLQHVLPDGCMKVRHFGLLHASCALPPDTIRRLVLQAHSIAFQLTRIVSPQPVVACCPTCGGPMRGVMRRWTTDRAFVDTG